MHYLIERGYIPLDKSWMIRVGVLDLLNGYDDTVKFLESREVSDDLKALRRASLVWNSGEPVDVGESATLYRFLKFASWKQGKDREFVLQGTLKGRKTCDNPEIVNYPLKELLKLDNGTSQWASASVLLGNKEVVENPPYKLKLTYEAVSHWNEKRKEGKLWEPRYDETVLAQAVSYLELLNGGETSFSPRHSEDYCFARAFGLISREEGEKRWPSLRNHESDRIIEMERALEDADQGKEIDSKDPRMVQAIAMRQRLRGEDVAINNHQTVNKFWSEFWRFLDEAGYL